MRGCRQWVALGAASFAVLGTGFVNGAAAQEDGRVAQKFQVMPRVTPDQFVAKGVAMVDAWEDRARGVSADRIPFFESVQRLFREYQEFTAEVAEIYPAEGLEWLLITDEVADSLTTGLIGPLDRYQDAHPEEVLTQGRQLFELEIMKIAGPPSRVLGFHVVRLGSFSADKVSALLGPDGSDDLDGLADGFLRHLRDWCYEYQQVHDSELNIYRSRLSQQDWIIIRLRDECGNTGKWKIKNQYMAMIGVDSTKTPPEDLFAHEFELEGTSCDDKRTILIDIPNFLAMQREVLGGATIGVPSQPMDR